MSAPILFDEALFDPDIITGADGSLEFSNTAIKNPTGGIWKVNAPRPDPIWMVNLDMALQDDLKRAYLNAWWRAGYGNLIGFRVRLLADYFLTKEVIAWPGGLQPPTGAAQEFKVYQTSRRPGITRGSVRRICKVVGPGLFLADGTTSRSYSITVWRNAGGADIDITSGCTFTAAATSYEGKFTATVPVGNTVKITCEFDTPMAFVSNTLPRRIDVTDEVMQFQLRELLPAELGIAF